jgi:hypothetical protein
MRNTSFAPHIGATLAACALSLDCVPTGDTAGAQ